ncbi:helix-turn-helix transcriptional regulator [Streptomyces sp. TRM68367]|uniref:helix-turn-helix domain-containing protein n=1 Tax=Streptomyces sp. TRM68367 TaxID=2758415 RepID=UPI00165C1976|nr:helix-turn-helix transcriptional regulator [Streptomyces sp. TRM68367]MBC9731378.1 helix-turn-helix transcriptional regulator [Streptomyces sp. TRM68367]
MTTPEPHALPPAGPGQLVEWRLRMTAAQRGVWTGTELRRLLAERAGLELAAASVSALFTKQPSQVKLSTLAALCTALDCTPGDLLALRDGGPPPGSSPSPHAVPDTAPPSARAATPPPAPLNRSLPPL